MNEIIKIILNWEIPVKITGIFGFLIKIIKDNKAMKESKVTEKRRK